MRRSPQKNSRRRPTPPWAHCHRQTKIAEQIGRALPATGRNPVSRHPPILAPRSSGRPRLHPRSRSRPSRSAHRNIPGPHVAESHRRSPPTFRPQHQRPRRPHRPRRRKTRSTIGTRGAAMGRRSTELGPGRDWRRADTFSSPSCRKKTAAWACGDPALLWPTNSNSSQFPLTREVARRKAAPGRRTPKFLTIPRRTD